MRLERKETWMLHFSWHEQGQAAMPCKSVEDGRQELHRVERRAQKSVLWAEVAHTVTTVETIKLDPGEESDHEQ